MILTTLWQLNLALSADRVGRARGLAGVTVQGPDRPVLVPQTGHSFVATCVVFSPDRKTVASGARDNQVILWDVATGLVKRRLLQHDDWVQAVAFSPDGRWFASGGKDRRVILWDLANGCASRTVWAGEGNLMQTVTGLVFDSHSRRLVFATRRDGVYVAGVPTGKPRRIAPRSRRGMVEGIALSPDDRLLAAAHRKAPSCLLDVASGRTCRTFSRLPEVVNSTAFSPDGRLVAFTGGSKRGPSDIAVMEVATGRRLPGFACEGAALSVAFSADGSKLVSAGLAKHRVRLWDVATGQELWKSRKNEGGCARFSPDGSQIAITWGVVARLIDASSGATIRQLGGHSGPVLALDWSSDGQYVAAGNRPHSLTIWDVARVGLNRVFRVKGPMVKAVAWQPNTKRIMANTQRGETIVWDLGTGKVERTLPGGFGVPNAMSFTPSGDAVAVGYWGKPGKVVVWDPDDGRQLHSLESYDGFASFGPEGRQLATSYLDERSAGVCIWDLSSGSPSLVKKLPASRGLLSAGGFSPDGRMVAAAHMAYPVEVSLWDVAKGKVSRKLSGHTQRVLGVDFTSDSRRVVSGSEDNSMVVWDVSTGGAIRTLRGHGGGLTSLRVSPDDRLIASGSYDGTMRLWDTASGKERVAFFCLDSGNEWLATTPEGYYAGSLNGAKMVAWRIGDEVYPVELFEGKFYRPDLVARAIKGRAMPADVAIMTSEERPPSVRIEAATGVAVGDTVALRVRARPRTRGVEITGIQVFMNGRPLAAKLRGAIRRRSALPAAGSAPGEFIFDVKADLPPGEAEAVVSAIALDANGLKSLPATLSLSRTGPVASVEPDLYVLAVGVSRYRVPAYDLRFARADAEGLAERLMREQNRSFRAVHTRLVADAAATASGIGEGLDWIESHPQSKDVAVISFAGHAVRGPGRELYFVPHDGDMQSVNDTCLRWDKVDNALRDCRAKSAVLFSDCCHAGAFGEQSAPADDLARGLVKTAGVMVFASSRGAQTSLESEAWGHGAFTKAILDGLEGQADLIKDGVVTLSELQTYVSDAVAKMTDDRQTPWLARVAHLDPNLRLASIR